MKLFLIAVMCFGALAQSLSQNPRPFQRQQLLIPAYFYPGSLWTTIKNTYAKDTGVFIANPNSGPGTKVDATYKTSMASMRASGVKVIGYVHTSYGQRSIDLVKADIDKYRSMYGVDGFFIDETAAGIDKIAYYRDVAAYIRAKPTAGTTIVLNPGTSCAEDYMAVGDIVVILENAYAASVSWTPPEWASRYPSERFSVIIHTCPSSAAMITALQRAQAQNVKYVYVTDDKLPNPFDKLPSYLSALVDGMRGPPPTPAACNAECAQRAGCTGTVQSVVGKPTCVCTCPTTTPQMCGRSSAGKYKCVQPSPGGVCDANGKCKTSTSKTAPSKTCAPC